MSVSPQGATERLQDIPAPVPSAGFVSRCHCGRLWNLILERGHPGNPGCVRCSCQRELVSWSGTIIFNAVPAEMTD
jgi:hypothetical protein